MIATKSAESRDSVAEILSRAFQTADTMPAATAELILKAKLPQTDVQRIDELLEQKRDTGLSGEQEDLLRDYLHVDYLLTILQSKARRALGQTPAA